MTRRKTAVKPSRIWRRYLIVARMRRLAGLPRLFAPR